MRVRKKKITVQQILIYAALCVAVFLSIFPIYWMIVASLKPVSETMAGFESLRIHHLTLENYQKVNAVVPMLNPVINSMFTMTMGTITSLLFCSLAGFAFAKFRFPGRDQLFMVVLLTLFIPQEVCVVPLYSVMRKLKLVNSLWSLVIPRAASALGIFYMRQYCMAIPNELIEASRIDGCSSLKMYTRVVVPVIKPAIASWAALTMISRWNDFFFPLIFLRSRSKYTLMVVISLLPVGEGLATPWPVILAGTTIAVLPIVILYFVLQKFQIADLMSGAVKG